MIFEELKSGRSVEKKEISLYKTDTNAKKYIYLIAGIFGHKIEGMFILDKLFSWLRNNHQMQDIPLIVMPTINIDGYTNQTSENSNGIKLIEHFSAENLEKAPEISFFLDTLKKYPPKTVIHFGSKNPPRIQFTEGGKHIASFISKFNFYELIHIEPEFMANKLSLSLPKILEQRFSAPLVEIQYPRLSNELSLLEIWHHNEKSLKDLFSTDFLSNYLKS